jgi:hypothetical protein
MTKKFGKKTKIALAVTIALVALTSVHLMVNKIKFDNLIAGSNDLIEKNQYQEAYQTARLASDLNPEKAKPILNLVTLLIESDKNFQTAAKLELEKKYEDAITHYKKVALEDKKNIQKSKDKVVSLEKKVLNNLLQQSKKYFAEKKYEDAYRVLLATLQKDPSFKEAVALQVSYKKLADEQLLARETQVYNKMDSEVKNLNIEPALVKLNAYLEGSHPKSLIDRAKANIKLLEKEKKSVIAQVQNLRNQDRYSQAIALVQLSKYVPQISKSTLISEINTEKEEYLKEQERIKEMGMENARKFASELVVSRLKAPSTASVVSTSFYYRQHPNYAVKVVVDAENSFGAMLRQPYLACIRITGENEYKSFDVQALPGPDDDERYSRFAINLIVQMCENELKR